MTAAYDPRVQACPHPGAGCVSQESRASYGRQRHPRITRGLPEGAGCIPLRCAPQLHGAARDAIDYAWRVVETENELGD